MENGLENLKYYLAIAGTGFTWLFGAWDIALIVLVVFMGLDYITGVLKGYISKEVSSSVGARGIAKKCMIFVMVIIGVLLDRLLGSESWVFRTIICYFYIANEGISILENCTVLGLPIPEAIKEALIQLKNNDKKGDIK